MKKDAIENNRNQKKKKIDSRSQKKSTAGIRPITNKPYGVDNSNPYNNNMEKLVQKAATLAVSKAKLGSQPHVSKSSNARLHRQQFADMICDPTGSPVTTSIDDYSGYVSLVKQHRVINLKYVECFGASFGGILFTGGMRENIFLLNQFPANNLTFTMANLTLDDAGFLSEASTNINTQNSTKRVTKFPRVLYPNYTVEVPVRDGVCYPGGMSRPSNSTQFESLVPAQLCTGTNIIYSSGAEVTPVSSNTTVYPCAFNDVITFFLTVSSNVAAAINIDVEFYSTSGNRLNSNAIVSPSLIPGVVTQFELNVVAPINSVAWNQPKIATTVTGQVTFHYLGISYSPLSNVAYPNTPTSFWTGLPTINYADQLNGNISSWRAIAGSLRLTDLTPTIEANGSVSARIVDTFSGPGDAILGNYTSLSSALNVYEGQMPVACEQNGLYAFLKFNDIPSRTFKAPGASFDFNSPYLLAFTTSVNDTLNLIARIEVTSVFEVRTSSQLMPLVQPIADPQAYAFIMDMIATSLQIGDNPNHLKRINRFVSNLGRWTNQGLDIFDNAKDQSQQILSRLLKSIV